MEIKTYDNIQKDGLDKNKKLQHCTAPEDKIGKERCGHVSSQFVSETVDEFIKRAEIGFDNLKDL